LIEGFDKLQPSPKAIALRAELIVELDKVLAAELDDDEIKGKQAKKIQNSGEALASWLRAKKRYNEFNDGNATFQDVEAAVAEFFARAHNPDRVDLLKRKDLAQVQRLKHELVEELRANDSYVLMEGVIEAYYPESINRGGEKVAMSREFCELVTRYEDVRKLPPFASLEQEQSCEFELIFSTFFRAH
jgi:hypothetical protein